MNKHNKIFNVFIVLLIASCESINVADIDNLFDGYVHIIGHGGSGFPSPYNPYPANSMISISRALDGWSVDGVEMDIQMTADSIPVLFHDASLESSSNCTGFIQNINFAELNDCRYRYAGRPDEKIISLELILNRYKNYLDRIFLFLDVKLYGHQEPEYADRLIRALNFQFQRFPASAGHIIVQSGSSDFLQRLRYENSWVLLMFEATDFNTGYQTCIEMGLDGLVMSHKKINRAQVATAHGLNFYITLTGISSRDDALSALDKNPDFVQTDNIPLLKKILN